MKHLLPVMICLIMMTSCVETVAAKGPYKYPPGQAKKVEQSTEPNITIFLNEAGLSATDQAALFYLANQAGVYTNVEEIIAVWRLDLSGLEIAFRFGFPPVLLDGELLFWRHPPIIHSPLPLARDSYKKHFRHSWGSEEIERKPGKYEYRYVNRLTGVTKRIEIKQQKYSYLYRSKVIEERLEIHFAAKRYEYRYRNRLTGEDVHRSGKPELIGWRDIPRYLPMQGPLVGVAKPGTPEINFKLELNLVFD